MGPVVAIRRASDVGEAVREVVGAVGGLEGIVKKGDRVLIKPNLCVPKPHDTGITTHPGIVEALIELTRQAGGIPVIGESTPIGVDTDVCLEATGVRAIAAKMGVEALNLEHDEAIRVRVSRGIVLRHVRVARTVLECDCVISVPVLKSHIYTGITCGLKNMKGVLPEREKSRMHMIGLNLAIAELNRVVLPDLVVVDAIVGMEGDAIAGTPVHLNLVLAGRDPVATDAVCARIAGLSVGETKHITRAAELGLGVRDLRSVRIDGPGLKEVARPFQKPWRKLSDLRKLGKDCRIDVEVGGACSACIGSVLEAITTLQDRGLLEGLGIKVFAIGPEARVPDYHPDHIIVGNCLSKFKDSPNHLPGCPPNVNAIFEKLHELDGGFDPRISHHIR